MHQSDLVARQPEDAALAHQLALELQRDVPAEQEERPVRHVDDAHQAEDQREAARDHEVEARERQAGERDADPVRDAAVDSEPLAE